MKKDNPSDSNTIINSNNTDALKQETYHEICINVSCKQEYLQDIIMQSIADIILEYNDGVEFINGEMIVLENEGHNS